MSADPTDAGSDEAAEPSATSGGSPRLEDAYIGAHIAEHHLRGKFLHYNGFGWMKFDGRRWVPVGETVVAEVIRQALIEFHRSEASPDFACRWGPVMLRSESR